MTKDHTYEDQGRQRGDPTATLSPRETEVVKLLALGLQVKEVAARLNTAYGTVNAQLYHLMGKLGVHSRFELIEWAKKTGLVKYGNEEHEEKKGKG